MIQIYEPSVGKNELQAVKKVFESKWIGKGKVVDTFITDISKKINTNVNNLITINSCTEGLFQSLDLYGISEGDEVILPSVSWVGTGNAIVSKKAKPVFCDVDKRTLNVNAQTIEDKITNKTKAVIILHYAGVPCEINDIVDLCRQYNIKLIEDNANSLFSKYNKQNTGTFGDMGIWSFDAMKILTTGDGGLVYCRDVNDIKKLDKMIYLGWDSSSSSKSIESKWWQYDVLVPGRRSIMNDIQAAIGVEQLKRVDSFLKTRKNIHKKYTLELSKLDWLDTPKETKHTSSYYMYHIQTKELDDRDKLARHLRKNNIYTAFRYYPLHKINFYESDEVLPNTDYVENHTLCIPLHQNLTDNEVTKIINTIKDFKK
ncbi:DegT/DnrJ/EryC1/StrS family aminotransferase [Candidatus Woesearchaeota archaeon]|jgi:aminotransferase|nr:DegT/DnrJ/EryC1/StrS family aminotransferase [Candidatus Woesearchaeota archaeon]MBT4732487.1 DegT/DnrJ/EryC1/StrS family aminotransferase [Candidatus Woesearchaeota archaeon]MBT7558374.1 DegT/DnrJ/EryC1/StrS family aminotransferase [Candidatus Woesearchaeota archaeon]